MARMKHVEGVEGVIDALNGLIAKLAPEPLADVFYEKSEPVEDAVRRNAISAINETKSREWTKFHKIKDPKGLLLSPDSFGRWKKVTEGGAAKNRLAVLRVGWFANQADANSRTPPNTKGTLPVTAPVYAHMLEFGTRPHFNRKHERLPKDAGNEKYAGMIDGIEPRMIMSRAFDSSFAKLVSDIEREIKNLIE